MYVFLFTLVSLTARALAAGKGMMRTPTEPPPLCDAVKVAMAFVAPLWALDSAEDVVRRLEGQRANGPATRASSTRSATGMGMVG